MTLDTIYTLAESAERLRMNKNALARLARRTGHCSQFGRNLLFSEGDLMALWQELRIEPRSSRSSLASASPSRGVVDAFEALRTRPPISLDRRVLVVLKRISSARRPVTYTQIERCGPRTIDELLRLGMVTVSGEDAEGRAQVKISKFGRAELKKAERWIASSQGAASSWRDVLK